MGSGRVPSGHGPVVFDAYGTLFDPHALTDRLETAFPGLGSAISGTWRATQLRATWLTSLMDRWIPFDRITADGLRYACAAHGTAGGDALVDELLEAYRTLPAYPDAADAMRRIGGPRLILTNGTADMIGAAVEAARLGSVLDGVLSSDEVKVYKPSPRIYALVTQHLGVEPEGVTFVSGNGWDCAGAAAFGFRAVRVARTDDPDEMLGTPRPKRIGSLGELPALLSTRA